MTFLDLSIAPKVKQSQSQRKSKRANQTQREPITPIYLPVSSLFRNFSIFCNLTKSSVDKFKNHHPTRKGRPPAIAAKRHLDVLAASEDNRQPRNLRSTTDCLTFLSALKTLYPQKLTKAFFYDIIKPKRDFMLPKTIISHREPSPVS